jgi:hypothetical protein
VYNTRGFLLGQEVSKSSDTDLDTPNRERIIGPDVPISGPDVPISGPDVPISGPDVPISISHQGGTTMKRVFTSLAAVAIVGLFVSSASAATNVWTTGYPKPGTMAGTIAVKGVATKDAGQVFTGTGYAVVWPAGGGIEQTFGLFVNDNGNWGEEQAFGLVSGANYNVYVKVEVRTQTGQTLWINTDTKQSKAK